MRLSVCGIAGVLYFDGRPAGAELIGRMNRALAHRGPDGEGIATLGSCGLGHRRLSIIDLTEAAKQPMQSASGRFTISYNGEVYNYLEIRDELSRLGHTFRSRSDTEVVLEAFARWGEDAFSRFNGMWAIAIWDAEQRTLTLSRDRFGVKPLLVSIDPRRILFASEAKAILAAEPELARPDLTSIARMFVRPDLAHARSTFFEEIEFLEPGTLLTANEGGKIDRRRWYRFVPRAARKTTMHEAAAEVREILTDAIRLRFRSDVPVGTCLSGGLDSSSIVALAKRSLGKAPDAFSVLYADPGFDERPFANEMIEKLDLAAHVTTPDGRDLPEIIERATYHQDGPGTGSGVYSQWHVMKIAAGRVKVLLDGQGGDELFAGYHAHYAPYAKSALYALAERNPGPMIDLLRDRRRIESMIGSDPLEGLARAGLAKLPMLRPLIGPKIKTRPKLLRPEIEARLHDERESWRAPSPTNDPLTDYLWDQVVRTSLPTLLHYEDRDSMAFSLEARTPFLDVRLVELAFALPFELKMRGATSKHVLREAMRGILPERVRGRTDKKGYPTPLGRWLRELHRDWAHDLILSSSARARGIIDPARASQLLLEHERGIADHSTLIYQLATLELFFARFIDRPFTADAPPLGAISGAPEMLAEVPRR